MIVRTIVGPASVTQSRESVVALLEYLGKPAEPLPQVIHLKDMVLVLSGKRDVYYAVTSGTCSCPSSTYRPGKPCKHQRKYFPGPEKSLAEIERESDEELASLHKAKWVGGFNGPVDSDTIIAKTEAPGTSNLVNVIDAYAPVTTEEEIRYWQKKQAQEA